MKFYLAATIKNKVAVEKMVSTLKASKHEITVDWTAGESVPLVQRNARQDEVRAVALRDLRGIQDADVFVLLTEPPDGRSMYVELGAAIALQKCRKRPQIFVVGKECNQSVFFFHPVVTRVNDLNEVLAMLESHCDTEQNHVQHENRLEEFRALRSEMISIISDRMWGQATYAALVGGSLALMGSEHRVEGLIFVMALTIPFLLHTIFREHSRIRMANYIRAKLEPQLSGMGWEDYLAAWRSDFGKTINCGWLKPGHRHRHIISLAGLYYLTASFALYSLFRTTNSFLLRIVGLTILGLLVYLYFYFTGIYTHGQKEYEKLVSKAE